MSGLFTAAYLRQIGWDIEVYERSSVPLVGRGAGITSHPELIEALESCGAGTANLGIELEKRILLGRSGRVIAEKPLRHMINGRRAVDPEQKRFGDLDFGVKMHLVLRSDGEVAVGPRIGIKPAYADLAPLGALPVVEGVARRQCRLQALGGLMERLVFRTVLPVGFHQRSQRASGS